MKLLFTHRYYYPDTPPYASMLRTIAQHFATSGHDVHVFASKPSYRNVSNVADDAADDISVKRCWVFRENRANPLTRILNVFLYCGALFITILRLRPDVVTASTFPPVIAGWVASLAARLVGAKFIYHMQDIHPEVSKYSGGRIGRGWAFRLLRWMDNQTLRRSSSIVVLSEDMANTLCSRGTGDLPIVVINNFLLENFKKDEAAPAELQKPKGMYRVIFAGNMGRFQNLPLLAKGVARCFERHPDLELFFLGDGAGLAELREKWGHHKQVQFAPFLPFTQARELIAESDAGLVSLTPDMYRVAFPSKMMTYIGLDTPVLALVEPHSVLAADIMENRLGVIPTDATAEAIETALERLMALPDASEALSNWKKTNASAAVVMKQWQKMVTGL